MCCTEWPCAVTSENYVSDPGTEPETITAHGCNVYYESAESQPPLPAFPHNEGCLPRIYISHLMDLRALSFRQGLGVQPCVRGRNLYFNESIYTHVRVEGCDRCSYFPNAVTR